MAIPNPSFPLVYRNEKPILVSDISANRVVRRELHQTDIKSWEVVFDNIPLADKDSLVSALRTGFTLTTEDGTFSVLPLGDSFSFIKKGPLLWSVSMTVEEVL